MWNLSRLMKFEGRLDLPALKKALTRVVSENDGARLQFVETEDGIRKYVAEPCDVELETVELGSGGEAAFDAWAHSAAQVPVWKLDAPLFRVACASFSDQRWGMFLSAHHIITDGTALSLFSHLLNSYHQCLESGELPPVTQQPSCIEYLRYEKEYLASAQCELDRSFWLETFSNLPKPLELCPDKPQPSLKSERTTIQLPDELARKVYQFCNQKHTSPYRVILAAYYLCLARYSGNSDIVISTAFRNRSDPGMDRALGMFVSTIPFRISTFLSGLGFAELVEQITSRLKEIQRHERYPFDLLVRDLRDLHGQTLQMQCSISQLQLPPSLPGTSMEFISPGELRNPLLIYLMHGQQGKEDQPILLRIDYQVDVFSESRIAAFVSYLLNLLQKGIEQPDRPLSQLAMLSSEEQDRLISQFNRTEQKYPLDQPLQTLFERQVQQYPQQTALISGGQQISYNDLNRRANKLANGLLSRGIQRNQVVALLLEKPAEVIIAILGVLKSGAICLPLETNWPKQRIQLLLEDSRAGMVIADSQTAETSVFTQNVLLFSDPGISNDSDENPVTANQPADTACLLYISEPSGRPAAVMLEHRSLVNSAFGYAQRRNLTTADRFAVQAAFSSKRSLLELWPTLCAGATLVLIDSDIRLNLAAVNDCFEQQRVTGCIFPAYLGESFIRRFANRSLRFVDLEGDRIGSFPVRNYQVFNSYGLAETSAYCADSLISGENSDIPIGAPAPNCRIHILDPFDNLQPLYAPGELCVAGAAVAKGYLERPERTTEVFVEPASVAGERIFRTGDQARRLADGSLLLIGRKDRQVIVRGQRIEPAELEASLTAMPGIRGALVIPFRESGGKTALCLYLEADEPLDCAGLRNGLAEILPDEMLPHYLLQPDAGSAMPGAKERNYLLERMDGVEFFPAIFRRMSFQGPAEISLMPVVLQYLADRHERLKKTVGVKGAMRHFFKSPSLHGGSFVSESITEAPKADYYPLTALQKQLYVLSRVDNIGATYHLPCRLTYRGSLNISELAKALQLLVARHEALRTSFQEVDGKPVQVIKPSLHLKMRFEESSEELLPEIEKRFVRPFILSKAPLFRVLLVRTAPDCHHLLLDIHQIVADALSVEILLHDLHGLINNLQLPLSGIRLRDYAVWEQKFRESSTAQSQAVYWYEQFSEPQLPELPLDHPRKATESFDGETFAVSFSQELCRKLRLLSEGSGVTRQSVMLSAIHILLSRYANQEEMITGTLLTGRRHEQVSCIAGPFANMFPIRTMVKANSSFRDFALQTHQTMLAMIKNQDYPLEQLYENLNLRRGAGRHPLFDVSFSGYAGGFALPDLPEATVEHSVIATGQSMFDLGISYFETDVSVRLELNYKRQLFEPESIRRLGNHLVNLLSLLVRQPDLPLGELDWLDDSERRQLLFEFNPAPVPLPPFASVVEAFERNVASLPSEHPAIVAVNASYSYSKFNAKANQLARLLRNKGVGPDELVGILADRSAEVPLAMLAVLKAGGAYTAIDPKYPSDRIRHLLENSGTRLLLGNSSIISGDWSFDGERLALDDPMLYQGDESNLEPVSGSSNLAYVIYTSGSTGNPKGVMIEHRSMVNFMNWYTTLHQFTPADQSAVFATFSFDASVAQVWAPLVSGATLHVISEELRLSPADLNDYFEKHGVTHAHFPTQFAEQFMAMTENRSLKRMVVGGDALRQYRVGSYKITNEYGPSETTVASTAMLVDRQYERVPIGKPADNTRVYILDRLQRLQPLGVPGEICIAGSGLARGYRKDPDLTLKRFVADPFFAGEKMYKTGDLGRWLPDGNLEFLGRVDFQVKIRGYRIELGEIEQQLLKYPGIRQVVVVDRSDDSGNKFLCAYYESDSDIPVGTLKQALGKELPEYMIPGVLVGLRQMPINRNGKIDRKALPDPIFSSEESVAPRNQTEELIVSAWRKVLKEWKGGVYDNFFEVGGDSLRSIALAAELQKNFEARVSDIFRLPTIAEQAQKLKPASDNLRKRIHRLRESLAAASVLSARLSDNKAFQQSKQLYHKRMQGDQALDLTVRRNYQHLLLTGSTGYLGCYLLRELLQSRDCMITALVRGGNSDDALKRLRGKMEYYFGPGCLDRYGNRLIVLASDLVKERLGLEHDLYDKLANRIDCIIHSAANVRHYGLYEEFHASNVGSTEHLLEFARTGKIKDFNYISTVSTGQGLSEGEFTHFTEFDLDIGQKPKGVYILTKLEAEKTVAAARKTGLNTNIFRVGNICFDSNNGIFQENIEENGFYQQVKSYALLGVAPQEGDERNLTFPDQCSTAIVTLFDLAAVANQIFHLSNPHRVRLSSFMRQPGLNLNIQALPLDNFLELLAERFDLEPFHQPIERLMLHQGWLEKDPSAVPLPIVTETERTDRLLEMAGFTWSVPDAAAMRPMILEAIKQRRMFLKKMYIFGLLDDAELDELSLACRPVWLQAEDTISTEGEEMQHIYALMSGHLEVSKVSAEGWAGTIRVMGAGELVGKDPLLHQLPAASTVNALFDGAALLEFELERLQRFLNTSPRFALGLAKNLSQMVNRLESLFVSMR